MQQGIAPWRRNISRVRLVLLLIGIVLFCAYSGKSGVGPLETSSSSIPSDIVWQLEYILIDDRMISDFIGTPYVQFFDSLQNFGGHDGCNEFCVKKEFYPYPDGTRDVITSVEQTLLACGTLDASGEFIHQKQHFIDDLINVTWYSLEDDELRLYYSADTAELYKSGKSYWHSPSDDVSVMVLRPRKEPTDNISQCQ